MSRRSRACPWWLDGAERPSVRGVTTATMEAGAARAAGRYRDLISEALKNRSAEIAANVRRNHAFFGRLFVS